MLQGRRREALPRSVWMGKRGIREVWCNREWTVKCFRALRLWPLRARTEGHSLAETTRLWELRHACEKLVDALTGLRRTPQPVRGRLGEGRFRQLIEGYYLSLPIKSSTVYVG